MKRKVITVPENLSEFTVSQILRMLTLDKDDGLQYITELVSIACEIDISLASKMPVKDRDEIATAIGLAMNKKPNKSYEIQADTTTLKCIQDWNAITFGEYISMDDNIRPEHEDDIKTPEQAKLFLSVAFREWENDKIKPFTAKEDSSIFENTTADLFLYAVSQFFELKQSIAEQLPILFTSSENADQFTTETNWGWFGVTDSLASGEILKHNEVTELNVWHVMRKLAMQKEITQMENLKRVHNGLRTV